jgi:hypothetical protein
VDRRYSGISLNALRRSRAVLSRGVDDAGRSAWVAELSGTGHRATGATRVEALRRVREAAISRHLPIDREDLTPDDAGDRAGPDNLASTG